MKLRRAGHKSEFDVELGARTGSTIEVRIDGRELSADLRSLPDGSSLLRVGGSRWRVFGTRRGRSLIVSLGPVQFEFIEVEERRGRTSTPLTPEVTAPMPGKILAVLVSEGDVIETGQPLVVMEAMKMETTLRAESPALVKKVRIAPGDMVEHGAALIELSPAPGPSAGAVRPQDPEANP